IHEGSALVALFDLRQQPAGPAVTIAVDASDGLRAIYVPPGVAHGFLALTDVVLQYMVDAPFDGSDEFGFAWDDPQAAIPWPNRSPTLSKRDRTNPSLAEVLET